MTDTLQELMKRTSGYVYRDGLVEISLGLIWVFAALMHLALVLAGNHGNRTLVIALALAMVVLITAGSLLTKRVVGALKERMTYPRTGYVEMDEKTPGAIAVVIALTMLALILVWYGKDIGIPALTHNSTAMSFFLAAISVFFGIRAGTRRFYLVALFTLVAGALAVIVATDETAGTALVFGTSGATLLLTGTYALLRYLRENPNTAEQAG